MVVMDAVRKLNSTSRRGSDELNNCCETVGGADVGMGNLDGSDDVSCDHHRGWDSGE